MFDTVVLSGLDLIGEALEEERISLCGLSYQHDAQRHALPAGLVSRSLSVSGDG